MESVVLWIARDKNGSAWGFTEPPRRGEGDGWWGQGLILMTPLADHVPALAAQTWEDEPIRVRLEVVE